MKKTLLELFPEINISPKAKNYFKKVLIDYINAYKKDRRFEIYSVSDSIVPTKYINELETEIEKEYKLQSAQLMIKYDFGLPLKNIIDMYWNNILAKVTKKFASCIGFMKNCALVVENSNLIIELNNCSSEILNAKGCNKYIEKIFWDSFSIDTKVIFKNGSEQKEEFEKYVEFKSLEENKILETSNRYDINTQDKSPKSKLDSDNNSNKKQKFIPSNSGINKRKPIDGKSIIGKAIRDAITPMKEITQDSGTVCIKGEVFRTEFREIKGGKFIFIFDITDLSWSLTVKMFLTKERFSNVKDKVKPGVFVAVRGEAQYDKFSKELSVMAYDITEVGNVGRMDKSKEKRVELHLHTQMSSMDAISSVKDIIKRAASWGHKSIAITDHGVVQAFPDAHSAAKANNIKIIYGVECYLLDDDIPIVFNSKDYDISGEFVVFDIETTGFNFKNNKITEIGAVKVKDFEVIDTFNTFVNPEMPIPHNIVKLTGITDEMVENSPKTNEALNKFFEFAKGVPLVAHNAQFDIGFIKYYANLADIEVDNISIDTLQFSRWLVKDISRYKLSSLAKYFGISLQNAHRASDDAYATAEIFIKLLELLKLRNITNVSEINKELKKDGVDFKKLRPYHAIILVKNMQGLLNLYKIISKSHLEYFFKKPRVLKKMLEEYREGLIIGSACEAGELYSAVLNNRSKEEVQKIVDFYDYLEIQPIGNNLFQIEKGLVKDKEELQNINKNIVKLGRKNNKPVVATCDVHFLDPEDEIFRRILMSGQGFSDADDQAPLFFRTTEEMLEEFKYLGEEEAYNVVIRDTNNVSDMTEKIIPIPEGTFPPFIEGAEEEIKNLSLNKAKEIYGNEIPEIVQNQLDKELNSIIKNGFSVMYIISQKLVWKSVSDGYLVGSRGSVGSSFVANMVGITEVNSLPPHYICKKCKFSEFITDGSVGCGFDLPEKTCPNCGNNLKKDGYDIPFETFLGFDGDKEPDIDLNFSGDYQAVAHKYTEELFGEGHVYRAGTIGTIAEKTAYGFVKNYLDEKGVISTNAEINRLVKGCTGVKRTTGQHPGGIMIVPQDTNIYKFCPIQRPADDVKSNIITTHFDYHSISGKLLKLDILGHDDPTVIRMLEDLTGVDATNIEIGEKKTMGIFSSTEPLGIKPEQVNSKVGTFAIPEFGTKFVRQMLVDTNPKTFSELIRISGLSHGTDVWLNNAQDLVRNGIAKLPEVICTRDDIMLYLLHAGLEPKMSFKIMEDVRKGKGLKEEYEEQMKLNNVPDWYIQSCKKIKYMFPKAHAAAYVMMAFRIAWFKVYHPLAFYVTYYTVRADDFDAEIMINGKDLVESKIKEFEQLGNNMSQKEKNTLTILEVVNEMYARSIKFLPIDLYKSEASKFLIVDNAIRPPLNSLQGLGINAAKSICNEREKGDFISIEDLRIKSKVSKTVIEILEKNKCLYKLPETSQVSFFQQM
ncbi:MAG: PolC-type DNA polymerase III [Clostridiales bacterium]